MSRPNLLFLLTISCFLLLVACNDSGDTPTDVPDTGNLQAMAECASVGIDHLGFAVETSLILFHVLDESGPYTPPFEFHYNVDTGEFNHERELVSDPGNTMQIAGVVAPLATVEDGLQQYDNFTVAWTMKPRGANEDVASGTFRVVHNGLTSPPNQTETMRVIPATEIWSEPAGGCRTEFNQFEMIVHHLVEDGEISSAYAGFQTTNAAADTLNGYLTVDPVNNVGSVTGFYDGTSYTCSINLDTYAVDCAGN